MDESKFLKFILEFLDKTDY